MPLSTHDTLGPYEVIEPLGAGGMGEVYKARDTRLGRSVAIKVLPEQIAQREDARARFEREARAVASLNHPNICVLHDIGPNYMVMELIDGETLAARIGKGAVPLEQATLWATQIADALDRAHRAGVIHRDLKPQNIMVTRDGVKVLDFGLAKSAATAAAPTDATLTAVLTNERTIVGTPAYMAPEQFAGQDADARSDIWAFGAVLYEMVTGRKAFEGTNYTTLVTAILAADPPPMSVKPFPPTWLERLVRRCLEKDPENRWQSMRDVVLELKSPPPAATASRSANRSMLPWLLSAGLALACLAFSVLWLRGGRENLPLARRFPLAEESSRFVFSPDGRWLLAETRSGLRLKAHDRTSWRDLPGTEFASQPFWAPDSSAIGFFAVDRLKILSLADKGVQVLGDAPSPAGGAWHGGTRDGAILFSSNRRLRRFDLATRKSSDVPIPVSASQPAARPRFLPEGDAFVFELGGDLYRSSLASLDQPPVQLLSGAREVQLGRNPHTGAWHLFYMWSQPGRRGALWTTPINPSTGQTVGAPVRILTQLGDTGFTHYAVAPDGAILWRFAHRFLPIYRFRWVDPSGKLLSTFGVTDKYTALALSPDQKQIAVEQLPAGSDLPDIWVYDLQTGTGRRLSIEPGYKHSPVWAADSKSVYYTHYTDAGSTIIRRAADGSGQPEALLPQPSNARLMLQDITPDGEYLIADAWEERRQGSLVRLKVLGGSGGKELEPLAATWGYARVTKDGRWLLTEGPSREWWAIPYPPTAAQPVRLQADVPFSPCLSGDGRLLYGMREGNLTVQQISTNQQNQLVIGKPAMLFPIETARPAGSAICAASGDGSRILVIATDDKEQAGVQMLTDWTALLRNPDVER